MRLRQVFRSRSGASGNEAVDTASVDTAPPGSEPTGSDPVAEADALEAEGRLVEAVDVLAAHNRRHPDHDLEQRLIDLRHRAGASVRTPRDVGQWPPAYPDPFPGLRGEIPEVAAGELTTELLGGAVVHHGALLVRGAFADDQVARLVDAIETTHQNLPQAPDAEPEPSAWYRPFPTSYHDNVLRRMVARQGGTWLGDSPASTEIVLGELEAAGITSAIAGHLGERPVFSLQKSTLRRSLPTYNLVAWHQDGSFFDRDVRTMNVWVALSPCGGDYPSPGLEVLPARLDILPVDGVMTKHSVSYDLVAELAEETPLVIPRFEPGDALLFDEHLLHRTHLTESMSEIRYALECWFFAPSNITSDYLPLLA
ncbi:MAG: phytanoyl-CoA dioxygenase family protein [Actinobacteria bacterium]|nr:phytanoyl-CoA dioxygenase family protein [Actinomycetota bacterium]